MSTGPIAFLPTPHGMMWSPQYVSISGSPSGSAPPVQVPDFGNLHGDLGGRAERVARRCARYEKYYTKQAAKYAAKGSKRAKRRMEKYKAKILACVQAGVYTPRDPSLLAAVARERIDRVPSPGSPPFLPDRPLPAQPGEFLPGMETQAQAGIAGSGGLPGGPIPWLIAGAAALGAIALIATKPPQTAQNPRRRRRRRNRR